MSASSVLVAANTATFSAPLPMIANAARMAGFVGLEVWNADIENLPGGAAAAASMLAQAGLQVPTFQLLRDFEGSGAARQAKMDEAASLMDVMQVLGAPTLLLCANTNPGSSGVWAAQIDDLRQLADLAESRNIRVGFEPLAWSQWINDYAAACKLVNAVDHAGFGIVLDVFHLFSRRTPLDVLDDIPIDKLLLVQLSNAIAMPLPPIEIARHHRLFPADGEWPVADVVRRLTDRGYTGYFSIEVFNDEYKLQDPAAVAAAAMQSFHALFACGAGAETATNVEN
ncbi:MAG: sugar phosphate isomerase/epimerase [Gammaproteobacteria bacterium]|nr:sugar phosphate isomerase/epimerase [Gammaproteobacteria bacterium]MDH5303530.1 sugar phosphate isomerase/epimerase [Gammaproteobacteria bacterium]MDH5321872.1 sugar phosphate isomerase/epimerase [Gammaproteobacteria bacterium]